MLNRYEHHLEIEKQKLCPFLLRTSRDVLDSPCNWHQNIELLLIIQGSGSILYETNEIPLNQGDLIVINTGAMHWIYSSTGISYHYLIIDEKFCNDNGIFTAKYSFDKKIRNPETLHLFNRIKQEIQILDEEKEPLTAARLRKSVLELLLELCTKHADTPSSHPADSSNSKTHVQLAISYINEHYPSSITLDAIAEYAGINKYYLTREFKKYTGQTPFTYANILRCKKAEVCILDGMTITEAAHESGFETLSYFSRTYSRLMGHSPSTIKSRAASYSKPSETRER